MDIFEANSIPLACRNSKHKHLTNEQRNGIFQFLLQRKNGHKLKKGAINETAAAFDVSRLTVSNIWREAKSQIQSGALCADVSSKKKGNCGRKRKDYSANINNIENIPLNKRSTIRSLSSACQIPPTTLFKRFKEGKQIRRISSTLKPLLTEENKKERLRFCMSNVKPNKMFEEFYDRVHIDEKWFYLTQDKRNYYVLHNEEAPLRACKSKRFIPKIMFMAAVARPRYDHHRKQFFDGKIGLWPFVYNEPAKRNSKNRPKGTLITKPVESINAAEVRKMLIENVLPAIKAKFPAASKSSPIFIQQDNAKPHSYTNDENFVAECNKDGWNIIVKAQPPNSPDFNVLDLGFFSSIQSLQHQSSPQSIDQLIECVTNAFNSLSREKLDNIFLTLQTCMESAMLASGGNNYKIQHIGKERLRRNDRLPASITCKESAIAEANRCLNISIQ